MRIGLVLSGGMARGALQVGALKALDEFVPKSDIVCMSCASVGALNGYAYATNKLDRAEKMWKGICIEDNRLFISQVLRSFVLQEDIKNLYSTKDEINNDFFVSLLNYSKMKLIYKNLAKVDPEDITTYLKACVAMPVYNHSVSIDGYSYFDGAMIDNIPVYPLLKKKLDYIICFHFDAYSYKFETKAFDSRVVQITFPNDSFIKQSFVFKQEYIERMIADGYDYTAYLLDGIIGNDYTDAERIKKVISYRNDDNKIRITADCITTGFNKFSQKFLKKDIR